MYAPQIQQSISETKKEVQRERERERFQRVEWEAEECEETPIYLLKGKKWWGYRRKTQHMQAHGVHGPPPNPWRIL